MHSFTEKFADFCEKNLDLIQTVNYNYESLSACILDCVYSLRAVYITTTVPVVNRYAKAYMNGNRQAAGDTTSMLIYNIEKAGGPVAFTDKILKNHQKIGGKGAVSKGEVCYQLARYLKYLHIETVEDFQNFECQELLEIVIRSVKGMGDAGTSYLFMLAGDPNRCKPDVHIHHCVKDACGRDVTNEECQELFTDAVFVLKDRHPDLTVRGLDSIIWNKYSQK
jgi:hypothetical protein